MCQFSCFRMPTRTWLLLVQMLDNLKCLMFKIFTFRLEESPKESIGPVRITCVLGLQTGYIAAICSDEFVVKPKCFEAPDIQKLFFSTGVSKTLQECLDCSLITLVCSFNCCAKSWIGRALWISRGKCPQAFSVCIALLAKSFAGFAV